MAIPSRITSRLDYDPQNSKFNTSPPRLQFARQNFIFRAAQDWNLLPDDLRHNQSVGSFKRHLRKWIKDQRTAEPD